MSPDPAGERNGSDRRLRYLKVGAVGATVVGLGVFAGLAAAGTDGSGYDHPDHHRADPQAPSGYGDSGYDADHDGRIGDPGDGGYLDNSGQPGSVGPGTGGSQQSGTGSAAPQEGYAPSAGGNLPSQGSSGAS